MRDFIMLMHGDAGSSPSPEMWDAYFATLSRRGIFDGGSAIGSGRSYRKQGVPAGTSDDLTGYIRIRAESFSEAEALLTGHPVWECGGTVEIRELPRG